ncbi:hypothetical protein B9H04_15145, partial [Halorubrum ezzemoulense DSM 17463]
MSWHAVDAVDRAVDATRRLLFPFEAVRWVKLAALAAGMAGGGAAASPPACPLYPSDAADAPQGVGPGGRRPLH